MARVKKIGIYKLTSPSSKIYIGQSVDLEKRHRDYKSGWNYKNQVRLLNSIKKYGFEAHKLEIITECTFDELDSLERYYQDLYHATGINGLNCKLTKTDKLRAEVSKETREKISAKQRGIKKKPLKEETKRKLSEINMGRKMDDNFKEKCRQRMIGNTYTKGVKSSEETKRKISAALIGNKYNLGKKHSEERKRQISELHKGNKYCLGYKHTEETKRKVSENSSKSILIFNNETGIYYPSIKSAHQSLGINISIPHLGLMIRNKYPNKTSLVFA